MLTDTYPFPGPSHGRVLKHPHIVNLYYSPDWDANRGSAPSKEQIQAFTRDLVSSSYFNKASQYGVGSASFDSSIFEDKGGSATFCGQFVKSKTDFLDTLLWVSCEAGSGRALDPTDHTLTGVPGPGSNTLYVVYLPPGTAYSAVPGSSPEDCNSFSGYHFFSAVPAHKGGVLVPQSFAFAVIRSECASTFDKLMAAASHEIIEASTDPIDLLGWINRLPISRSDISSLAALVGPNGPFSGLLLDVTAGEAADICENVENPVTGSPAFQHPTPPVHLAASDAALGNDGHIAVAPYWSNDDNACVPAPAASTLSMGSPLVRQGDGTWVTSSTNLTLTATTARGFPGDGVKIDAGFSRDGTTAPVMSACGSGTGTASCRLHLNAHDGADGRYTLKFRAVDTTTGALGATHAAAFRLDNTAPVTTASLAGRGKRGWYNTPVWVTLSAGDGAGVGVSQTGYAVDGGTSAPYSGGFMVSGDSNSHSVTFSSTDKLGNAEMPQTATFRIDRTPPALSVNSATDGTFSYTQNELTGGMFTNASSLSVSYAAGDALSGLYAVRLDGSPISLSGTVSVPLWPGVSTHMLTAEDVAGNVTTLYFSVVSVPPGIFSGGVDPRGAGFWGHATVNGSYTAIGMSNLLNGVDVASRAFGPPLYRYDNATSVNYLDYLAGNSGSDMNLKVRRELLVAWLNLVSGREPAAQGIDVRSVQGWETVITDTGGSSSTTALNLVRETERRLAGTQSSALLETIKNLLEKLNAGADSTGRKAELVRRSFQGIAFEEAVVR